MGAKKPRLVSIGSLFTGIAGLDVGIVGAFVEAGIPCKVAWQCEIDPFCTRVLEKHFPDVKRFSDVATVQFPPAVDVLIGGFVCQDVSAAGKGAGLGEETRSGNTWRHYKRIIREVKPSAIVVENVASGAKRWLPKVVQELQCLGYRSFAVPIGAVHVGAPHRRLRVFVVAYRDGHGREGERRGGLLDSQQTFRDDAYGRCGTARTDTGQAKSDVGIDANGVSFDVARHEWPAGRGQPQHAWEPSRTIARDVKCIDRPAKLRACGNAVVPQCGLVVGRILIATRGIDKW